MPNQSQLVFNCTPAQFPTAIAATLPAAGFQMIPIGQNGIAILSAPTFTGTTSTASTPTVITGTSSTLGLKNGMLLSGIGVTPGAVITALTANSVTMSLVANVNGSATFTGTGIPNQIDYAYDGNSTLRFFGANPLLALGQPQPGIPQSQFDPVLSAYLISVLAATLGAPVNQPRPIPAPFVP